MRYFIDTHILCFIVEDVDSLTREVRDILDDYGNRIYIPFECVRELIMLHQSGKIECKRWKSAKDIIDFIVNDTNIDIKYMEEEHLYALADLPYYEDHKDPFDKMIIAHAIPKGGLPHRVTTKAPKLSTPQASRRKATLNIEREVVNIKQ